MTTTHVDTHGAPDCPRKFNHGPARRLRGEQPPPTGPLAGEQPHTHSGAFTPQRAFDDASQHQGGLEAEEMVLQELSGRSNVLKILGKAGIFGRAEKSLSSGTNVNQRGTTYGGGCQADHLSRAHLRTPGPYRVPLVPAVPPETPRCREG